jgi:hypothetical protein
VLVVLAMLLLRLLLLMAAAPDAHAHSHARTGKPCVWCGATWCPTAASLLASRTSQCQTQSMQLSCWSTRVSARCLRAVVREGSEAWWWWGGGLVGTHAGLHHPASRSTVPGVWCVPAAHTPHVARTNAHTLTVGRMQEVKSQGSSQ